MKVSILFLAHNHERFVADALRSALSQDYPSFELIVHDDGSTDETLTVIKNILEKETPEHIKVVLIADGRNYGLHEAFNRGAKHCTGEVIMHMSGDDISSPRRLTRHVETFKKFPEVMLVVSEVHRVDESGRILEAKAHAMDDKIYAHNWQKRADVYAGSFILGASASYRECIFSKFLPIKSSQCHAEDNAYWFRALMLGKIYYLNERLLQYRLHGSNYSDAGHDWRLGVTEKAKRKHLEFLRKHGLNFIQWQTDIEFARARGYISQDMAERLTRLAKRDAVRWDMYYLSLSSSPWQSWIRGFLQTLRWVGRKKAFSMLTLRLSDWRKSRYWKRRAKELKF